MLQNLDKSLVAEAETILEDIGMDLQTVIRMTLKRIVRENSIAFLLPDTLSPYPQEKLPEKSVPPQTEPEIKMTKSRAATLFRQEGISLSHTTTFSSKNKTTQIYWANPAKSVLSEDWHLILHDWPRRSLHLFFIPRGSISVKEVKYRADNRNLIDLQILPDDSTFTDNRSKLSFAGYLVKSILY
ncbi:MAG: hypothetical protein IJN25_08680 [Clostridia bacterium]|nr:hypothetical protein [Clostridia bacterium]